MNRRSLIARAAAAVVLAGALVVGTSGCTFITPQATLIRYDASDGVSTTIGDLAFRNVLGVVSKDGKTISLLVTAINTGSKIGNFQLQYNENGAKTTSTWSVRPHSTLTLGTSVDAQKVLVVDSGVPAGAVLPVYVQGGDLPGSQMLVPVLNGSFGEYAPLVPADTPAKL